MPFPAKRKRPKLEFFPNINFDLLVFSLSIIYENSSGIFFVV